MKPSDSSVPFWEKLLEQGRPEELIKRLEHAPSLLDEVNAHDQTILWLAARHGQLTFIKKIFNTHSAGTVDIAKPDHWGRDAIDVAEAYNQIDIAHFLRSELFKREVQESVSETADTSKIESFLRNLRSHVLEAFYPSSGRIRRNLGVALAFACSLVVAFLWYFDTSTDRSEPSVIASDSIPSFEEIIETWKARSSPSKHENLTELEKILPLVKGSKATYTLEIKELDSQNLLYHCMFEFDASPERFNTSFSVRYDTDAKVLSLVQSDFSQLRFKLKSEKANVQTLLLRVCLQ